MDKRAQKRNKLHELKEKVDIFGRAAEEFSPTFAKLMDELRNTDTMIRDSLLEQDPSLRDVLKSAKSNFNRREYMTSIADLKTFHDKVEAVVKALKHLQLNVDEAHEEFLFDGLPSDALSGLKSLKEKFDAKKASLNSTFVKEANFFGDLWYVLNNDRAKAMRGWEKRYPSRMKQVKNSANSLIRKSEVLFSQLLVSLKEMSSARAARNIDRYLKAAEKLIAKFEDYDKDFRSFYENHVKGFLEKLFAREAEKAKKQEEEKEVRTEETDLGEEEVASPSSGTTSSPFAPSPGSQNYDPNVKSAPSKDYFVPSVRQQIDSDSQGGTSKNYFVPSVRVPVSDPKSSVDPFSPTMRSNEDAAPVTPIPVAVRTPPSQSGVHSIDLTNPNIPKPPRVPHDLTPSEKPNGGRLPQFPLPESFQPSVPNTIPNSQIETPDTDVENNGPVTLRSAHPLIKTLQVLASEGPEVLALEISKYASSIRNTDPKTSAELFAVVNTILNSKE